MFKFKHKKVYGRHLFYPMDENGKRLLKIFRKTCIEGQRSMGILKSILDIEIEFESINWEEVKDG